MQSRDWLPNLKICARFPDSENAQHNLEIVQIPRLQGIYIWEKLSSSLCITGGIADQGMRLCCSVYSTDQRKG